MIKDPESHLLVRQSVRNELSCQRICLPRENNETCACIVFSILCGSHEPNECTVRAIPRDRTNSHPQFGRIFASYDPPLGLVPIEDQISIQPLLNKIAVDHYRRISWDIDLQAI